jgi:hypothetical protein
MKSAALAQALFLSLAYADASNLNPNGKGCVDPSGYLQCYEKNVNQLTQCMIDAKKTCSGDSLPECELACGNVQLAANIGCWLTSCWNQVYPPLTLIRLSSNIGIIGVLMCLPGNCATIPRRCR